MKIDFNSAMNEMADDGKKPVDQSALDQAANQKAEEAAQKAQAEAEAARQAEEAAKPALPEASEDIVDTSAPLQSTAVGAQAERPANGMAAAAAAASVGATAAQQAKANTPAPTTAAQTPTQSSPAQSAPAQSAPAQSAPVQSNPVPPARRANEDQLDMEPRENDKRNKLIAAGAGVALLAVVGGALLSQGNDPQAVDASPAPTASSPADLNLPQASDAPSEKASAEATAWAWSATDPSGTTIPTAQINEWCGVDENDQIAPLSGDFYPGSAILVGPKNTRVPTQEPYPSGWRTCQLGYHKQPVKQKIGFNEIRDNDDLLKKACVDHSGFDFGQWRVVNSDTRTRPRENNNHDGSVALEGPDGWLADCELSIDQPTATLTFIPPQEKGDKTCPRAQAVQRSDMMPGMPPPPVDKNGNMLPPPVGPDGKMLPPPPGMPPMGVTPERMKNLYWITAFGRVPDVGDLRKQAHHGTYQLGNGTEGDSELIIKNGVAIANHTWFLKKGDPTNSKPTLNFYDKSGKKLYSCTAS